MRQELRNLKIAIDGQRQKRINKRRVKKPKAKRKKGRMKDLTKDRQVLRDLILHYLKSCISVRGSIQSFMVICVIA